MSARCTLFLFCFLAEITIGTNYTIYGTDQPTKCPGGINDICILHCNEKISDFSCDTVGKCIILCEKDQCLKGKTLDASNSNNGGLILNGDLGFKECIMDGTIILPINDDATLISGNNGLKSVTINGSLNTQNVYIDCSSTNGDDDCTSLTLNADHTQNIYIDCSSGIIKDSGTQDCKEITINAQNANYLYINVSDAKLNTDPVNIYCPVNSTYNGSEPTSCIIDASNGGYLEDVYIHTLNGIPLDVWIYADNDDSLKDITITSPFCNHKQSVLWVSGDACWKTQSPTNDPTLNPTTSQPTTSNPTTNIPTTMPTTSIPTDIPTKYPTSNPITSIPTNTPSIYPTSIPTRYPSYNPTSSMPTNIPSTYPTINPSSKPTLHPTVNPIDVITTNSPITLNPITLYTTTSSPITLIPTNTPSYIDTTAKPTWKPYIIYTTTGSPITSIPTNTPSQLATTSKPTWKPYILYTTTSSPTKHSEDDQTTIIPNKSDAVAANTGYNDTSLTIFITVIAVFFCILCGVLTCLIYKNKTRKNKKDNHNNKLKSVKSKSSSVHTSIALSVNKNTDDLQLPTINDNDNNNENDALKSTIDIIYDDGNANQLQDDGDQTQITHKFKFKKPPKINKKTMQNIKNQTANINYNDNNENDYDSDSCNDESSLSEDEFKEGDEYSPNVINEEKGNDFILLTLKQCDSQNCWKYFNNFVENKVGLNDLDGLSTDDWRELIPEIGPRNQFRKIWKNKQISYNNNNGILSNNYSVYSINPDDDDDDIKQINENKSVLSSIMSSNGSNYSNDDGNNKKLNIDNNQMDDSQSERSSSSLSLSSVSSSTSVIGTPSNNDDDDY